MTERFHLPGQRNSSAHRRADADQVPAVVEHTFENAAFDDDADAAVFDESFIAAAPIRELSADARARQLQLHRLPDQRTGDEVFQPLPVPQPRWSVRPSHHFAALRPLPVALVGLCVLAAATVLITLLR